MTKTKRRKPKSKQSWTFRRQMARTMGEITEAKFMLAFVCDECGRVHFDVIETVKRRTS